MFRKPKPTGAFSYRTRASYLDRVQRQTFDLVIIGGGITGAGIARDASMRGLSVALLEKGDFASGTSSRSSKMIHGGLRYLRHLQIRLVKESLREREVLLKIAPHLVHPFPYILPVYEGGPNSRLQLKVGLVAYDLLAGSRRVEHHTMLSADEVLRMEPTLRRDRLRGGFRYFDCLVDDARLTLATIRSAASHGAAVISYAEVTDLERDEDRVTGVRFRDRLNGRTGAIGARVVVNATGPWTDELRAKVDGPPMLRPTKGIHLTLPHSSLPLSSIVAFPAIDERLMFAVPLGDCTYVGTTDTDYTASPDQAKADAADVEYLLDSLKATFQELQVSPSDVTSTWAGVRPLVSEEGAPSDLPRDYEIQFEPPGLVSITGGKLTTYRAMAEELVDLVVQREGKHFGWSAVPCRTAESPLPGGHLSGFERFAEATASALEQSWGLPRPAAERLLRTYGTDYVKVLGYALPDRRLLRPLLPDGSVLRAEAVYATAEEMALTLEDFMTRRTDLMLFDHNHGLNAASEAARLMARVLGWNWRQRRQQVQRYREAVAAMTTFAAAVEEPAAEEPAAEERPPAEEPA
jgi:glycerol-3-phosphate dehydrogenase